MLQINKVELTNFGIIQGTNEFLFDEGLNIIQAENGKGKSSLVQSIEMLLTNSYEGSYEDYLNDKSDKGNATLWFTVDSKKYCISLSLKRGKSGVTTERVLYDSEEKELALGEEAITYLDTIIDPTLTRYSLIAKQKPIDNIVTCKDSERLLLFKKFKDLNFESDIQKYLVPYIEQVKKDIIELDKEIYRLENYVYSYRSPVPVEMTQEEYLSNKLELQKIVEHNAKIEGLYTQKKEKESELERVKEKIESYKKTLLEKSERKEALDKSIADISSSTYFDNVYDKRKTSLIEKLDKIQNESTTKKATLEKELEKHTENFNKVKEEIETFDKQISEIKILKLIKYDETELEATQKAITEIQRDIQYAKSNVHSFENGVCPTCGSECSSKLNEWNEKVSEYEKKLEELQAKLLILKEEKVNSEKAVEDNQNNKNRKTELVSEKEKKDIQKDSLTVLMANKLKEMKDLEVSLANALISHREEMEILKETIKSEIQKEKDSYETVEKDIEKDISSYTAMLSQEDTVQSGLTTWLSKHTNIDAPMDGDIYKKKIEDYEKIVHENDLIAESNVEEKKKEDSNNILLAKYKKDSQALIERQTNYEQAKTILLKDFPNYVIEQSIEAVEQNMNQFIEDVYYKSLGVSLKPTKTSIKLEYGTGEKKIPAHRLSGAESKLVSLAFINNFNRYIGLSCLIMDEPDAALDTKRQEDMYEILLGMKDVYRQMIIITHSEKMLNYLTSNTETNIIRL